MRVGVVGALEGSERETRCSCLVVMVRTLTSCCQSLLRAGEITEAQKMYILLLAPAMRKQSEPKLETMA